MVKVKETGELDAGQLAQRVEPHRLDRDGAVDEARCRVFGRGWNFESVGASGVASCSACADGTTVAKCIATMTAAGASGRSRVRRRGGSTGRRLKVATNTALPSASDERAVESAWRITLPRN